MDSTSGTSPRSSSSSCSVSFLSGEMASRCSRSSCAKAKKHQSNIISVTKRVKKNCTEKTNLGNKTVGIIFLRYNFFLLHLIPL